MDGSVTIGSRVFFEKTQGRNGFTMIYLPNMFLFSEFSGKYPFCERRIWVLDDGYVLCAASTSAIKVSQAGMPQNNDSNGEILNVGNVINQPNFDGLYMFIPPKKK